MAIPPIKKKAARMLLRTTFLLSNESLIVKIATLYFHDFHDKKVCQFPNN